MIPTPTNTFVRLNSSPPSIATPMPTTEDNVPIAARPMCILLRSNLRRSGLSGVEVFGVIWNILIARLRALASQMLRESTVNGPSTDPRGDSRIKPAGARSQTGAVWNCCSVALGECATDKSSRRRAGLTAISTQLYICRACFLES
jgi:hypothetical protein